MYDPSKLITELDEFQKKLNRLRSHLANECDEIAMQWWKLGEIGGRRADTAAGLLGKLRPHLEGIQHFCRDCVEQIDAMKADPFQRNTPE